MTRDTSTILCLGVTPVLQRTMIFDHFVLESVNRARQVIDSASGKVNNVARVVHQLDGRSVAVGFLGGSSGAFIRRDLDREGVKHDFVEVSPPTRTCVTILDRAAAMATELVEEAAEVEASAWSALQQRIEAHLERAALLVMSGSLPPGAPPEFWADCIHRASKHGVRMMLDAAGEPLKRALAAGPLIVKPNRAELAATMNISPDREDELRTAMHRLIDSGARWAIVSQGVQGVMITDGRGFWRLRPPGVDAINPIGSGDSLAAGIAVGISRGQDVLASCRLGVACGAANAMTMTPGNIDPGVVTSLQARIEIESLG